MANVNADFDLEFSGVRDCYFNKGACAHVSIWNGREVKIEKALEALSMRHKFYYAGLDQSISAEGHVDKSSDGSSSAGASGTYSVQGESEGGTSYSGNVSAYGEVNDRGNVSGGVQVEVVAHF